MQYLIIIKIPEETVDFVFELRQKYGFRKRVVEPHITMVPPLVTMMTEDELVSEVSKIKFHKFMLTIDGFGFFEGRSNVINLNVIENPKLTKLYVDFRDLLEERAEKAYGNPRLFKSEFIPHVMVEKRMPEAKFRPIKKDFVNMDYNIRWTVDRFWMYRCQDDGMWKEFLEFFAVDV